MGGSGRETGPWALLIDGENIASGHAGAILASHAGGFAVRRVYGDVARLNGWSDVPDLRIVHAAPGRNSADILLAVEAMALAQAGTTGFVIATADGGLVHLVRQLRETGHSVVVAGCRKSSRALRVAPHRFVELAAPAEGPPPEPAPPDTARPPDVVAAGSKLRPPTELDAFLAAEIGRAGGDGLPIDRINPIVLRNFGIRIGDRPEKTWRGYLTASERAGRFICDPKGPLARVRLVRR
jgi:hypothetical protein